MVTNRPRMGSASGRRYRYHGGSWALSAFGGRVMVADSTTLRPSGSSERGGQIQVDPVDRAVVDPLEPGVQAGAELYDGPTGMLGQEVPDPDVEDRGADDPDQSPRSPAVLARIERDRVHYLRGLRVAQDGPLLARFPRPPGERDEERLLNRPEPYLLASAIMDRLSARRSSAYYVQILRRQIERRQAGLSGLN